MLSNTMISALFAFNQSMNDRLWTIITKHLTDEQFTQPNDYSIGSIRNQLVHMADAQRSWFSGLLHVPNFSELNAEDYKTRESALAICQQTDQVCLDTVRGLKEADLEHMPDGWIQPIWVAMMQMSHHSMDHRAQILRMLHDFGAPTFDQTFAVYMESITPMPMQELDERIHHKRAEWDALLRRVPAEKMTQPLLNDWSVRDAVGIITWKERRLIEFLKARKAGNLSFGVLTEAEQTRVLETNRALSLDALLDQHQAAHRDMLDTLHTLTEAELMVSGESVGLPIDEVFWKVVASATWWSYPTFIEPLRQFLNGSKPAD